MPNEPLALPETWDDMEEDIEIREITPHGVPIEIKVTDKPVQEADAPVALVISYDTAEQMFLALATALHVPRKGQSAENRELHGN